MGGQLVVRERKSLELFQDLGFGDIIGLITTALIYRSEFGEIY